MGGTRKPQPQDREARRSLRLYPHPEKLPTLREEKEDYRLLDLNLKKQEQHKP